jgi:hypothetical protein
MQVNLREGADAMHMHVHCLHTQQGMKLHRTPPRATYDIHECYAMQYDAMI